MRQKPNPLRFATAALGASVVLPLTSVAAQPAPVAVAPPPVAPAPPPASTLPAPPVGAPAPVPTQPPPINLAPLPPVSPQTVEPAAAERPATRTPSRAEQRPPARIAIEAPAARAERPPEPAAPVADGSAQFPEVLDPLSTEAPAVAIAPEPIAPQPITPAQPAATGAAPVWPWIAAGAALLLALLALFGWRRRRAGVEARGYATPRALPPAAAGARRTAHHADPGDVAAMAASSQPEAGRPWLEFLMRPVRAGTDADKAVVEFALVVGNTGSVPARDVRISTWMFADGDTGTEMERSLIEPPADAKRTTTSIAPGDGAQVDTAIALPRDELRGKVLPVIVADARYTLPDGSEGRTSARFAVGLPNGEGLEPFTVDLPTGLREDVEARLHGAPQRA